MENVSARGKDAHFQALVKGLEGSPLSHCRSRPYSRGVSRRLFIGSSSTDPSMNLAKELHSALTREGERATLWPEAFAAGQPFTTSLATALGKGFGIFILADDDIAERDGRTVLVPRDNVVFEAGMSVGGLGLARTVFVCPTNDRLHLPTDLAGVTQLRYTPLPQAALGDAALRNQARSLATDIQGTLNEVELAETRSAALSEPARSEGASRPDPSGVTIEEVLSARATLDAVGSGGVRVLGSFVSHRLFGHGRIVGEQRGDGGTVEWLVQFPAGPCLVTDAEIALLL